MAVQDAARYPATGALSLDLGTTYYWRVDEANDITGWDLGYVWEFTVPEYLVVDNFELYGEGNDPGPPPPLGSRIWYTWRDGEGWITPEPSSPGNGTGAIVDLSNDPTRTGRNAMTYYYDNDGMNFFGSAGKQYYSEMTADTANLAIGSDWTRKDVKTMTLYFYGDVGNDVNDTERMYVKINDEKVPYPGDMNDLQAEQWQEWNVDLTAVNTDLANVTEFSIGFGHDSTMTPAGAGTVYFDDIRLYPAKCIDRPEINMGNLNGDCVIDARDLAIMGQNWLIDGLFP